MCGPMTTLTLKVCTKKKISETGKTPLCSPFLVAETNHSSLVYLVKTCVTLVPNPILIFKVRIKLSQCLNTELRTPGVFVCVYAFVSETHTSFSLLIFPSVSL